MTDYIKREDALNTIRNTFTGMTADTLELRINDIPSADVAPVVRCKECMYSETDDMGFYYCVHGIIGGYGVTFDADTFCSYGERRKR